MNPPKQTRAQRKQLKVARKKAKQNVHSPNRQSLSSYQRKKRITNLLARLSAASLRGNKPESERIMFNGFMELGGVYVKFLQLMMLKTRFFTTISAKEKMTVYDDVAADQIDIHSLMRAQLSSEHLQEFARIDDLPFAGGSFGQVYFAEHKDGTPLIIKVLRPSLAEHINSDLRVLGIVINILKGQLKIATDVGSLFKNFRALVLRETDYITEARNAQFFYDYFEDNPYIVIPKTYAHLCSPEIIVQEYLSGLPLTDVINKADEGIDPRQYVLQKTGSDMTTQMSNLGRELIHSFFIADNVFGDPHPGNLKLMTDNRVGIMDFGIAGQPPEDRKALLLLLQDVVNICEGQFDPGITFINGMRFFTPDLHRSINTISMTYNADQQSDSDITQEIKKAALSAFDEKKDQADFEQLIRSGRINVIMNRVINDGNRFALHVVMGSGSVVTLRAADGYLSMIEALNLTDELIPNVISDAIQKTYDNGTVIKGRSETMEYETAVNVVSDWAQNLIESDPMFFAPLIQKIRRSSVRQPPPPPLPTHDQSVKTEEVTNKGGPQ